MRKKNYPTDLHDSEWERLEPLLPEPNQPPKRGRPTQVAYREILNALLYVARSGCAWDLLPHDFPPSRTVYYYFLKWSGDGTWKRIHDALVKAVRVQAGRSEEPTVGIIDSQSVKTTIESGRSCGYDPAKRLKGRKRHAVVDSLGLLLSLVVHDADIQDRDGAEDVLKRVFDQFWQVVKIFADTGYDAKRLAKWVQSQWAELQLVQKLKDQVGFVVHAKRWLVERLFAWLGRWRRLSKDYEVNPRNSEAFIYLALTSLMLAKLEHPKPAWRQRLPSS
ncbi:MAG: IS5 family transposase [Candidatus Sericytochromatia bacterium]